MSSQKPMKEKGGEPLEHGLHGDGHVLPGAGGSEEVKIDSKGNVLRPTPSNDSMDPLNWSKFRKHTCLAIVALYYFMFTFLTTVRSLEVFNHTDANMQGHSTDFCAIAGQICCLICPDKLHNCYSSAWSRSRTSLLLSLGIHCW